ncbi:MAG: type II secretion system F family protein [Patescibacteria group bacterium]|jgi:type IV pilus assembly protein PilC|nr:type II secretion system F family protein [Patescibacteria group bacterium]
MTVNFSDDQLRSKGVGKDNKENQYSLMDKINMFLLTLSKVPLKERLFFVQHLGIMLKAGISLSKALKTISNQSENKYFQSILADLASQVEKGSGFSDSLRKYEKVFGEMFISMIDAGELSGKLEEVLHELFIQMKKEHALISKVKGALTYPAVIIMAMLGIGTFMLIFVIPKITEMFDSLEAELPLPTKILIAVSDALANNGILSLAILIISIIITVKVLKTYKGKFYFQLILLKTPVFGPIIKKINLARFARNISSLLKTDIMIIKCFQITANVLGNLHYRKALEEMAIQIKKGTNINEIAAQYPKLFPPMVVQMISIGEETGEIDNILMELAEFYEEEVDQIMQNLPAIIEPLLILGLGVGVGGVAVAVIMPMYALTSAM